MGLFSGVTDIVSGVFGGGSSGSTSTTSSQNVEVSPVTNIDFDLDKLAQALENQAITEQKTAFEVAQFQTEKEQAIKSAEISKDLAVKSAELKQNETIFNYVKSFVFLGAIGGAYYIFKKRGKK